MPAHASPPSRTALIAGASGLVGREILRLLLDDPCYHAVLSLGRRPLSITHPKLTQQSVDFAALAPLSAIDDVYIALGTTIKSAGSQAAMRAVDQDAVLAVAKAASSAGATRLALVSAMGANAQSGLFYPRLKGETENALALLGFAQTVIARPSQLEGDRAALGQDARPAERLAQSVMRWCNPLLPANYRSIRAADVAAALHADLGHDRPGLIRLDSGQMQGAAAR